MQQQIQSTEKIKVPTGRLCIKALDCYGNELWKEETQNLVTNDGRQQILHLMAGDVTNRSITTVGFGTNNTATAVTDTALTGAFTKAIGTISYPSLTRMVINFTLLTSEANGMSIVEFGLICGNGKLFSRLTRGAIAKTNAIQLVCTWTFDI